MLNLAYIIAPRIGTLAPAGGVRWERPHHSSTLPQRMDLRLYGGNPHRDALRGRLVSVEAPPARSIVSTESAPRAGHHNAQEGAKVSPTEVNVDCRAGGIGSPAQSQEDA
jgi:hypothetical protein